jgi:hypothetical protein
MSDRIRQWGGVAAIVFVVLILISAFIGGSPPAADDAADKIRAYFVDNRDQILVANLLGVLAIPFVLWFVVVLRDTLRGDDLSNALGTTALVGLTVTAPMALAGGALSSAPIYVNGVANNLSDDTLRLVFEAQSLMFAATAAGIIVFSLFAGLAIRRTGALPAFLMWLAFLATAGNLVAAISTAGAGASMLGFAGLLTFALFVLATGITIAVGKVNLPASAPA